MKKQFLKKLAFVLCIPLLTINAMATLTHGSIKGTAIPLYNQYDAGTINLLSARAGKTFDYKVVTIGTKSWGYTNLTGATIQGNGWSSQLRYWGGATFGTKTENWLTNRVAGTPMTYGSTTSAIPSPLQLSFLQEITVNEFTETQRINYDVTLKNSAVTGDNTAPVITSCTAAGVTGNSVTLNISGSDDQSDLFYYVTGNGLAEVLFLSGNTLTGLTPSTVYNLTVTPIDFSGNEGTPSNVQFTTTPSVNFSADNLLGFPVMTVTFTNTSTGATSYEWNFGDGTPVNTLPNPTHAYQAEGSYTVTLKATNDNVHTSSTLVKTNYIVVNAKPTLPVGELLYGGNMENANFWLVDCLNTPAGSFPVGSWNNTANVPAAGAGGCLYVNGPAGGSGVQYAIYQKVSLIQGHVYEFNGAYKDLTADLGNFWTEVYIGTKPAGGGADYGATEGTLIAKFDLWNKYTGPRINGTFKLNAGTFKTFTPVTSADYYFVAKMGTWSGSGFQISMDELSLKDLSLSTGVAQLNSEKYKITTNNSRINIDGVIGVVELFDISGRQIQSAKTVGTFTSNILNSGLYIVRIDGISTKVSVK